MNKQQFVRIFAPLIYIGFCLAVLVGSQLQRGDSYDMLMYVAAAKSIETSDINEIHRATFAGLKANVAKENYASYFNNKYRKAVSESPELLAQQLPFYQIRIVYNSLVYAVHRLGANYYSATHIVNALAVFFALIIFYFAFREKIQPLYWLSVPVFLLLMGIFRMSRMSISDGLAMTGVALTAYLLVKEKKNLLVFLLPLLVLVRTDMLLFVFIVATYSFIYHRECRWQTGVAVVATLISYVAVNRFYGNYGWSTLFYFQFIDRVPNPADLNPVIQISDYIKVFSSQLKEIFYDKQFLGFFLILMLTWFLQKQQSVRAYFISNEQNRLFMLSLICFGYVLAHFVLFPLIWYRFFIGQYVMAYLVFLAVLTLRTQPKSQVI